MGATGGQSKGTAGPQCPAELKRVPILAALDDGQLAEAFKALELREVRARKALNYAADVGGRVGFVWHGRFRVTAQAPGGPQICLGALGPGEAFGFAPALLKCDAHESMRLIADQAGALLLTEPDVLLSYASSNTAFVGAVVEHFARHALGSTSRVFEFLALDVRARLCGELLRLGEAAGQSRTISPAPTHANLGAQIGAAREVVTRHLLELQNQGLVACRRGEIELTQLSRLRRLARAPAGQHLFRPRDA